MESRSPLTIRDVMSTDFVSIAADASAAGLAEALERTGAAHLLIRHSVHVRRFHLLSAEEVRSRLDRNPTAGFGPGSVAEALRLDDLEPLPALSAFMSAEDDALPERCVVLEDEWPVGIFDLNAASKDIGSIETPTEPNGSRMAAHWILEAAFPIQVAEGSLTPLMVRLVRPLEGAGQLPVALPPGARMDVVVLPGPGLEIVGPSEGSLVLPVEGLCSPLQFNVQANRAGRAVLRLYAFHVGCSLGRIELGTTIVADAQIREGDYAPARSRIGLVTSASPDLTLLVLEHEHHGRPAFSMRLSAADSSLGLYLRPFEPVVLRASPRQYFSELFEDVEALARRRGLEGSEMELLLERRGALLFEQLIPERLRALLWTLRNRIKRIRVDSEDPWIPWELCRLYSESEDRIELGPFLCEYAMTRWIPGIGLRPALRIGHVAVVAPADSLLPMAEEEREFLQGLADTTRRVETVPATWLELQSAFSRGEHDVLHFIGHGGFQASSSESACIFLEDQRRMTPADICGTARNLRRSAPLVFLNACRAGRGHASLTGVGGFASRFLNVGASAFVGALWNLSDTAACNFARVFYERLLAGTPVGDAALAARTAIRVPDDPTWLAYTVYADSFATVLRAGSSSVE